MIVKFDGKDIKEMRDLPRVVADTPVGKQTPVIIIRKGKEETKTVTLGRLEDGEKLAAADPKSGGAPDKSVVKKTLGIELANMSDDLRKRYKIKDTVKGVVITGVDCELAGRRQALVARRRHRRDRAGGGRERRRPPGQDRQAQEGRPQVGAAAGGGRRRRAALRGAEPAVARRPKATEVTEAYPSVPSSHPSAGTNSSRR